MKIRTTATTITPEKAMELAAKENNGLIGAFFNKLGHVPKGVDVLDCRKIYYPYYVGGAILHFKRAGKLPDREVVGVAVMEAGYGHVEQMRGQPRTSMEEVKKSQIVISPYSGKDAELKIGSFLAQKGYRKYKAIPDVKFMELYALYKPHFVCRCKKGNKEFYKVIDAEIGQRNYFLDIKMKDLKFWDRHPADNKIEKFMYTDPEPGKEPQAAIPEEPAEE